jgi:hypothetical protein
LFWGGGSKEVVAWVVKDMLNGQTTERDSVPYEENGGGGCTVIGAKVKDGVKPALPNRPRSCPESYGANKRLLVGCAVDSSFTRCPPTGPYA